MSLSGNIYRYFRLSFCVELKDWLVSTVSRARITSALIFCASLVMLRFILVMIGFFDALKKFTAGSDSCDEDKEARGDSCDEDERG